MIVHEKHLVFGRLPVVQDRQELSKYDVAIHRTEIDDLVAMDRVVGPATHLREIVAYIEVKGKPSYHVVRDDVYRVSYRLKAIDAFTDTKLSGLYSSPEKAVEAVVDHLQGNASANAAATRLGAE